MFFKDDMSHCQEQIAKTVHFDQNERLRSYQNSVLIVWSTQHVNVVV